MRSLLSQIIKSRQSFTFDTKASQVFACINKNTISTIFQCVELINSPSQALKWLLIIHKVLLKDFKLNEWFINSLQSIRIPYFEIAEKQNQRQIQQIIPYYLQYLKKRAIMFPQLVFQQNYTQKDDIISISYQILNMISEATRFNKIYYTFGRYFKDSYGFIQDFNILIAKDVRQLYNFMSKKFITLWNQIENDIKSQQVYLLNSQIQAINQSLNYIYYNNYYYRSVRKHIPNWVRFEVPRKRKVSKDLTSSQQYIQINKNIQKLKTQIQLSILNENLAMPATAFQQVQQYLKI